MHQTSTTAYTILFFAIFVSGFLAGDIGGDDFRETFWFVWKGIKKTKFKFLTKKFWYNRKLNKQGIIKQVLCLLDSYSTNPNTLLVRAGEIYNVIHEKTISDINWGDIRGSYIVKEHGWEVEHSRSVFIDYHGENVEKLMEKHLNRRIQLSDWFVSALRNAELEMERIRKEEVKNFKFLNNKKN